MSAGNSIQRVLVILFNECWLFYSMSAGNSTQ